MDMNGAYETEVRAWCPDAEIVYDLFQVVMKYGREVIDPVRRAEAQRFEDDNRARKVIKGSRWLLLRSKRNIEGVDDRIRLYDLLEANRNLMKVYELKEDLKQLRGFHYPEVAKRFWRYWSRRAMRSGIAPLRRFARRPGRLGPLPTQTPHQPLGRNQQQDQGDPHGLWLPG